MVANNPTRTIPKNLVFVTTRLNGRKTRFLPFNQGRYGGAGNPPYLLAVDPDFEPAVFDSPRSIVWSTR